MAFDAVPRYQLISKMLNANIYDIVKSFMSLFLERGIFVHTRYVHMCTVAYSLCKPRLRRRKVMIWNVKGDGFLGIPSRHCIYFDGLERLCIMQFLPKTAVIVKLTRVIDVAYINELILVFSCAVTFATCFHSNYFDIYSRARLAFRTWHCIY